MATLVGCAGGTPQPTYTPVATHQDVVALREAMDDVINSPAEDEAITQLIWRVTSQDLLIGLTRAQVEATLGPGVACGHDPFYREQGFSSEDLYYEVGRPPSVSPGGVPILVVGFDRDHRCNRTLLAHSQ
jgi:hypothetical protein